MENIVMSCPGCGEAMRQPTPEQYECSCGVKVEQMSAFDCGEYHKGAKNYAKGVC